MDKRKALTARLVSPVEQHLKKQLITIIDAINKTFAGPASAILRELGADKTCMPPAVDAVVS